MTLLTNIEFSWPFSPLLYLVRAEKEIKWAIKLYLGEAPSISKLVAGEGTRLGS